VRRMGKNIANESCKGTDRHLSCERGDCSVHLYEKTDRNNSSDGSANQSKSGVFEAERIREITVGHNDKTGEPRTHEFFRGWA